MTLDQSEESRRIQQIEKDSCKNNSERNKLGQFSTPFSIATDVVRAALTFLPNQTPIRFLDPALGTGVFFSVLKSAATSRVESAEGIEVDPHYGVVSKEIWEKHKLHVKLADFTRIKPRVADRNLVVCNPPYVRHHHQGAEKERLRERTVATSGVELSRMAGLYCHFMLQAHVWMEPRGIGAWLVPSEFMDVNYGEGVKNYLLRKVTLLKIHRYDPSESIFPDALVSSALVIFRNELPSLQHEVIFSFGGKATAPTTERPVPASSLAKERKWTRFPLKEVRSACLSGSSPILGDFFSVKRGIATGNNSVFILSKSQVTDYGFDRRFLLPILPGPRNLPTDKITANQEGEPQLENPLYLINCKLSEDQLSREDPALYHYLLEKKETLLSAYLCRQRKVWFHQEVRMAPPLLCTYLSRSDKNGRPFRFIRNESTATATNVYLLLYPKPALSALLGKNLVNLDELWESLNATSLSAMLDEGRVYGGGLHKLEPKELLRVKLPQLSHLVHQDELTLENP